MAEQSEWKQMNEKDIECALCQKSAKEPKLLDCLHFFCKECIANQVSLELNQRLKCPTGLCQEETAVSNNNVDEIPTVRFIDEITEVSKMLYQAKKKCIDCKLCIKERPCRATKFCAICKFMCDNCQQIHYSCNLTTYPKHMTYDIDDVMNHPTKYVYHKDLPRCKEHDKKLKLYCITCRQLACDSCFSHTNGGHSGSDHKSMTLKSMGVNFPTLKTQLTRLNETQKKRKRQLEHIDVARRDIDSSVQTTKQNIDAAIKEAEDVLHRRRESLHRELESTTQTLKDSLDKQWEQLQTYQSETERVSKFVHTCFEKESTIDLAMCHDQMMDKMSRLNSCGLPQVTPACINAKLDLSESLEKFLQQHATVSGPEADVNKCKITGCIEIAEVGKQVTLQLLTVYENEQPCVTHQVVEAEIHAPKSGVTFLADVVQNLLSEGTYQITYTPKVRGRHKLSVSVNNKTLPESPFIVSVYIPPDQIKKHQKDGLDFNQPYQCVFTAEGQPIVTTSDGHITGEGCKQKLCTYNKSVPHNAQGIAIAEDDSVYVVFDGTSEDQVCIVKYDKNQNVVGRYYDAEKRCGRPRRIKYNPHNKQLYVCDRKKKCYLVFDSDLQFKHQFAWGKCYNDIAFGPDGSMYLSSKDENTIYKYNHKEQLLGQFGQDCLHAPRGLLYLNGYLYVVDSDNKRIAVFETHGEHKFVTSFGPPECRDLGSITADHDGYICVCDDKGTHIYKF